MGGICHGKNKVKTSESDPIVVSQNSNQEKITSKDTQKQTAETKSKKTNTPTQSTKAKSKSKTGQTDKNEQKLFLLEIIKDLQESKILETMTPLETSMEKLKEAISWLSKISYPTMEPSYTFELFQSSCLQIITFITNDKDFIQKSGYVLLEKFWTIFIMIMASCHNEDKAEKWNFAKSHENWGFFLPELERSLQGMGQCYWKKLIVQKQIFFMEYLGLDVAERKKECYENLLTSLINKVEVALFEENMCDLKCGPGIYETGPLPNETGKIDYEGKNLNSVFRLKSLDRIKTLLHDQKAKNDIFEALRVGRFDKKKFGLEHSVLLGRDGGLYLLMNSLSEEEYKMILENEEGCSLKRYFDIKTKRCFEDGRKKIVIGEGTNGKIRVGFPLSSTDQTNSKMHLGEIICVKKTANLLKDDFSIHILFENTLNDYGSDHAIKNIHSPDIYDMNFVIFSDQKHSKGYTMQQFRPIPNGAEFATDPSLQVWEHQKRYFLDIFSVVLELLNDGKAMTDLKPQNTLYDPKEMSGKLIDLAGMVNRKDLRNCKMRYVKEFTEKYAAPEMKRNISKPEVKIDLFQALSYSLGKMVNELVLLKGSKCPDVPKLREMVEGMMLEDPKKRWDIERGLFELQKIGDLGDEKIPDYDQMVRVLKSEFENKKYEDYGLKSNLDDIMEMMIETYVTKLDPELNVSDEMEEIQKSMDDFIAGKNPMENVYLLLGTSGTGKSTVLQLKYLDVVKKWKIGDKFPFYVDLATGINLKSKWELLNSKLGTKVDFSVFASNKRSSMLLFLDGFDESRQRKNLINIFLRDLGNKGNVYTIISCRTDYLSANSDDLFKSDEKGSLLSKRYIVPLNSNPKFDLNRFVHGYWLIASKNNNCLKSEEAYKAEIKRFKLQEMMKTNSMAFVVLEVLPELKNLQKLFITRYDIYKIFTKETIRKEEAKIRMKSKIFADFKKAFSLKEENIYNFYNTFAKSLSLELHTCDRTRVESNTNQDFFREYKYSHTKELKIQPKYNLIKILGLNYEIQKEGDQQNLIIGFPHDNIKNFYLVDLIREELERNETKTLELRHFVKDENFVRFLAEYVQREPLLKKALKDCIYLTKTDKSLAKVQAASNAITILIAAHVSFVNEDLKNVVCKYANIRDGIFTGCDFTDADLQGTNMLNCKLDRAIFSRTNLRDVNLKIYHQIIKTENHQIWCLDIHEVSTNEDDSPEAKKQKSMGFQGIDTRAKNHFYLAAGCTKGVIRLYEIENNRTKATRILTGGHEGDYGVNSISFSKDGRFLLSCSDDKKVVLWDVDSGKHTKTFPQEFSVKGVCFSPNGQEFVCCFSLDGDTSTGKLRGRNLRLINIETEQLVKEMEGHNESVKAVTFSANGENILSCSDDTSVRMWDKEEGKSPIVIEEHKGWVNGIAFSSDGKKLLSGSYDKTVVLWCGCSGKKMKQFLGHTDSVNSVCFSKDDTNILSGSDDCTIRLWDVESAKCLKIFEGHTNSVRSVLFSPDGGTIISGSWDATIWLWDKESGRALKAYEGHSYYITAVIFAPDGKSFLTASGDNLIKLWCGTSGKDLRNYEGHTDPVNSICFSEDGKNFASGSDDRCVILWELDGGEKWRVRHHSSYINAVSISPDKNSVVSAGSDMKICLMDFEKGKLLRTFEGHAKPVNSICFSRDSKSLVSGSSDKSIILWNRDSGQTIKKFVGHTDAIKTVCFASDGNTIVSGSKDKTIRLWNKDSGDAIKILKGHTNWVNSLDISKDGTMIISGSADHSVRLWQIPSGLEIKRLEEGISPVKAVAFSKDDNNNILVGNTDHTVKLYIGKEKKDWNLTLIISEKETALTTQGTIVKGDCVELTEDNKKILENLEENNLLRS